MPQPAPSAPTCIVLTQAVPTFNVSVHWCNGKRQTSIQVQRATGAGPFAAIATVAASVNTYLDTTTQPSTTYTYRIKAINSHGSALSATATITLPDPAVFTVIPPPDPASVVSPDGNPVAVTYPAASTSGGIAPFRLVYSLPSGSLFPVGTTVVTVTGSDGSGATATATFVVTVTVAAPLALTIQCPVAITAASTDGTPVPVSYPPPTIQGGRAPYTVVFSPLAGSLFPVGITTVTCTVTSADAQTTSCTFPVTVTFTAPPPPPPPPPPTPPPTYALTVMNGSGSGLYAAGTVVAIVANAPPGGQTFVAWINAAVANAATASTTLVMPAAPTTVTAVYSGTPLYGAANTSRTVFTKPPLPTLGSAGFRFQDPTFGTALLRVSDATTVGGTSVRSLGGAGNTQAWNTTTTRFLVTTTGGATLLYDFNAATMTATLRATLPIDNVTFSLQDPDLVYGHTTGAGDEAIVVRYNCLTGVTTTIVGVRTLVPTVDNGGRTYLRDVTTAVIAGVEYLSFIFGGTQQDHDHYAYWGPIPNIAAGKTLDSLASTINGVASQTLGVYLHAGFLDLSGRYVTLGPSSVVIGPYGPNVPANFIWDTTTNVFTPVIYGGADSGGGHGAAGYAAAVNFPDDEDGMDSKYRTLATPHTFTRLIAPFPTPPDFQIANHASWSNASPSFLNPVLAAWYRYAVFSGGVWVPNTGPWRIWDEELVAVSTDGSGVVYRFAHHRSNTNNRTDGIDIDWFYYTPRPNISNDGRWALFTSNWEKTLGVDAGESPNFRQDTFLASLAGFVVPPPPPPPPPPTLQVTCPANVSVVSATGGSTVASWPPATTVGGIAPVTLSYDHTSGALYPVGTTTVHVTAHSSDGQTATCSFTVTVTLAPPPPPPPGTQRVLSLTDLTWLGTFQSPAYLAANGGGVTYPFFTLRRLGGVLKTLWLTADHGGFAPPNELIQVDYPGTSPSLASAPLAAANFRNFGNGWLTHAVGQDGRLLNGLYASGLTWDPVNNCVWVLYSDVYNTSGYKDPVLIRGDINDAASDATAVTWSGPWRLTGSVPNSPAQADSHQTQSFLALVPPAYGAAHLGGATIALGGSYSSGGIAAPFNNVLWAPTITPKASTPAQPAGGADLAATCLIGGDITAGHRARRPGDYTTQFCVDPAGQGDTDPTSYTRAALTGFWTAFDSPGSCVWIDWDTIKGVLFFVVHGRGHIWYNNSGLHPPPPGRCAHGVVDRYFVTGPESVVRLGLDSFGVPEPAGDVGLPYGTGPDLEAALYAYNPDQFVPVAGGSPWQVPVHDWAYCLDRFPNFAVASAVGTRLVIKPNGMAIDQASRLLMIPCGYVTGGTLSGIGFYVNVFAVAP